MVHTVVEDFSEKLCAEHVSNSVHLTWSLSSSNKNGIATLKGITLSNTMMDLITIAPLQWGIYSYYGFMDLFFMKEFIFFLQIL